MEDSRLKKICLLFLTILTLLLTSCRQDTTQLAKDEFSKYYNGKDEVVLNIEDNLYFENNILKRENLEHTHLYGSILIYEKSVYYLSLESSNFGFKNDSIVVYSCDFYGDNTEKEYTQELNIYSKVDIETYKDNFYIEYEKNSLFTSGHFYVNSSLCRLRQ